MQIILVSRHLKSAKTLTIMPRHMVIAVCAFVGIVILASAVFSWVSVRLRLPLVEDLVAGLQQKESARSQEHVYNNLQLMATRLGELQARVLQLDSLSERLSSLAGVKKDVAEKSVSASKPGQGGPFISAPLSVAELEKQMEKLSRTVSNQTDELASLEFSLLEKRVKERLLPTTLPVKGALLGSSFGYRSDPIVGVRAMHEGLDFNAETGTPVVSAAAGVVLSADYHPDFGNVVDIDHGEGLTSRYAHLSRIDVKAGQMIKRGDRVGAVGTTGRSTGAHLHFEVRMFGVAQNPAVFLRQGSEFASVKTR